jgi:guanine deaminase
MSTLLLGQTLAFAPIPFLSPWEDCVVHHEHGGVLVEGGRIAAVGDGATLRAAHPGPSCGTTAAT